MSDQSGRLLKRIDPDDVPRLRRTGVDRAAVDAVRPIIEDVRARGEPALREHGERFGDLEPGAALLRTPDDCAAAADRLDPDSRRAIDNAAGRVAAFARAQRACLADLDTPVHGLEDIPVRVGHTVVPVEAAGCYAPGGRYPLVSSVLMTACAARAAGVERVVVASPKPTDAILAAAHAAGADLLLAAGGAQAIAALAFGIDGAFDGCDVLCGPGNKYVTAAKHVLSAEVGIDMLAGPSELLVVADATADPRLVAADLLAQAEHDADASALLVTTDADLADRVETELARQLDDLPTADTARLALANGFAVLARDLDEAFALADRVAPEHLELHINDATTHRDRPRHAGAIFCGHMGAEVFGDYGIGPNHTLPTGGGARSTAGLSVMDFLRVRTWVASQSLGSSTPHDRVSTTVSPRRAAIEADTVAMARLEGLEAHARAAQARRPLG